MSEDGVIRRRNLPHIDVAGKPFFITACLQGSISAKGLKRIRSYRDELAKRPRPEKYDQSQWKTIQQKLTFKLVDSILDGESPVTHLRDDRLAQVVEDAFFHFADQRYRLLAFVVMPSHHHWIFLPIENWETTLMSKERSKQNPRTPREVISHSVQSFSGTQCNRLLGISGQFWQWETFDHFARDDAETMRIIHYIEENPVVAGMAKRAEDFRWSSAYWRKKLSIESGQPIPKPGV